MQQAEYHEFKGSPWIENKLICNAKATSCKWLGGSEIVFQPYKKKSGGHTIPPDLADRFIEVLVSAASRR